MIDHGGSSTARLTFVWNYLDWGGAQIHLLAIMREAAHAWEITVLLPTGSSEELLRMLRDLKIPFHMLDAALDKAPAAGLWRKLQRQWRRVRAEYRTYRELSGLGLRDRVVHCEFAAWQSWIFYWKLLRRGAKVFFTMHNALPDASRWRRKVWRWRIGFLSRQRGFHILPSNQHAKDCLRDWVTPEVWEAMPVTYTSVNPVDIDAARLTSFDPSAERAKLGIPRDTFVVLTVGQFIDRKGRWTLLEAARAVCIKDPSVRFIWVTPELPNEGDARRIEEYQLGSTFHLVRSRDIGDSHVNVLTFFRIADCFALPSLVEGLPIALLEAMAMGVASIATNVYAIPEAVKHGETGLLIGAGDRFALANAVVELKHDRRLRKTLSKRGREFVLANFDERVAARTAISAYTQSLNE